MPWYALGFLTAVVLVWQVVLWWQDSRYVHDDGEGR